MQEVMEQFATDEESKEGSGGTSSRMYSPGDANDWLKERGTDMADLLVTNAGRVNLVEAGVEGDGQFAIAPKPSQIADGKGLISDALAERKMIRLTSNARRQLCKLLGVKGWDRYEKMHAPGKRLISDFLGRYSGDAGEKSPLVFRTSTIDGQRKVEGIVPQSADRTDESRMVRIAMREIIAQVGQGVRGVEFVNDPNRATRSFRIVFGEPCFDHDRPGGSAHDINYRDRIFPAIDMRLSSTGVVTPEVTLGIWRLICRNAAMDELTAAARWKGGSKDSIDNFAASMRSMAAFAVPFGNLLGSRCDELYDAPLDMSPTACIDRMLDLNAISGAHGEQAKTLFENGYGNDLHNGDGQWGMFNALTDSAKTLTPIQSRRSAEARSMTLGMQRDGFNGVCRDGLSISKSRADMAEFCKTHPQLSDIIAKAAATKNN